MAVNSYSFMGCVLLACYVPACMHVLPYLIYLPFYRHPINYMHEAVQDANFLYTLRYFPCIKARISSLAQAALSRRNSAYKNSF